MSSRAVSPLDSLTLYDQDVHRTSHEDQVAAVGARATLRTFIFLKLRSAAFKAFKPGKMGTLDELRASAMRHNTTLVGRISDVMKAEGFGGLGKRTIPAVVGNYLTSGVLFGVYSYLCPYPLTVDGTLHSSLFLRDAGQSLHKSEGHKKTILVPARAGAIAGAIHGGIATMWRISSERYYRTGPGQAANQKWFQVPLRALLTVPAHRRRIAGRMLMDCCSFCVFFASFESAKQLCIGPVSAWFSKQAWAERKDLWVISSTALAAGGASGIAFTLVRFPLKWTLETTTSQFRPLFSLLFLQLLARQAYRSVLPNAGTFLVMELVLQQLDSGPHGPMICKDQ